MAYPDLSLLCGEIFSVLLESLVQISLLHWREGYVKEIPGWLFLLVSAEPYCLINICFAIGMDQRALNAS